MRYGLKLQPPYELNILMLLLRLTALLLDDFVDVQVFVAVAACIYCCLFAPWKATGVPDFLPLDGLSYGLVVVTSATEPGLLGFDE